MRLHHEKLDAHQVSTEFLGFAFGIVKNMPPGYGFLGDQLKIASLSIPLNIAEGNGKFNPHDQSKFYKIARGSANECGAIFDAASTINVMEHEQRQKSYCPHCFDAFENDLNRLRPRATTTGHDYAHAHAHVISDTTNPEEPKLCCWTALLVISIFPIRYNQSG